MREYIHTDEKVEVEDYPYGFRLRTTLYDYIEYKKNKGYRHVTQTINPKTGSLNKPKASTYSTFLVRYYNEDGHIKTYGISYFSGLESIHKFVTIFKDTHHLFNENQIEDLKIEVLSALKLDIKASVIYSGIKLDDLIPLYQDIIDIVTSDIKNKTLDFLDYNFLDLHNKVNELKDPNFNPFKATKTVSESKIENVKYNIFVHYKGLELATNEEVELFPKNKKLGFVVRVVYKDKTESIFYNATEVHLNYNKTTYAIESDIHSDGITPLNGNDNLLEIHIVEATEVYDKFN